MSLESFVERADSPECRLVVYGADADDPLAAMLAETFDSSLDVESVPEGAPDSGETDRIPTDEPTVALVEDGRVRATSPMAAVYDALLGINSDLFVTGARGMEEVSLPSVLAGLEGRRFRLRGYPHADTEKLLLIVVSRWIERLAWERGEGTLRSAFQELSRIDDEVGTRETYETLAGTDVDVHLYGTGEGEGIGRLGTVHRGTGATYRRSWFVVFRPPRDPNAAERREAALVAVEGKPEVWDGFWTTEPDAVREIDDHIDRKL